MSIRALFTTAIVAFAILVSASGGYLAWREARRAVEAELDQRASWVAGAAAETGLQATILENLRPGWEDQLAWTSNHARLERLLNELSSLRIVRGHDPADVLEGHVHGVVGFRTSMGERDDAILHRDGQPTVQVGLRQARAVPVGSRRAHASRLSVPAGHAP